MPHSPSYKENAAPIVITGAGGFIGSAIIAKLAQRYPIVALERQLPPQQKQREDDAPFFIECDLTKSDSITAALKQSREMFGDRIAAVIHLAAYFDFSGEDHPLYHSLNVDGTVELLKALQAFTVDRFIYASSMLVNEATTPGKPINEQSPLKPKWAYPISKVEAEQAIEAHRGHLPVAILRLAGVYSDDCQSPTLAHQIQRIYEDSLTSRVYAGDPDVGQSALHLNDMARAIEAVVERRSSLPERYLVLIGEAKAMTYAQLQKRIGAYLRNEPQPTIPIPKPVAKAGAWLQEKTEELVPDSIDQGREPFIKPFMIDLAEDHYELDISYAKSTLEWEPQESLSEKLGIMLEHLCRDPVTWYARNKLDAPWWLQQLANSDENRPGRLEQEREAVAEQQISEHENWRWAHGVTAGLGVWLLASPSTMGYAGTNVAISEMLCGLVILVCGLLALDYKFAFARWITAITGLWLAFAPLVFFTESPAAYLSGSLIGLTVSALALIAKPNLGISEAAHHKPMAIPPGWDYAPSSWAQRLPIVVLAVLGLLISRYMAAYQLEHIPNAWDPFFGSGTEDVITSKVSEAWPVPDAGLGAFVYSLEILAGLIGSRYRWHQMPWLTLLFGFLIVPLGVVSITFIIIQPIVIGTWCTLCLIGAAAMLLQIPYSVDEILATLQFLWRHHKAGNSWFLVLLRGGVVLNEKGEPVQTPSQSEKPQPRRSPARSWLRDAKAELIEGGGVSPTWPLLLSLCIGIALMFSRVLFNTEPGLAHADHLLGALIVTVAVCSFAEAARSVRWINGLLGCALIGAPFLFEGGQLLGTLADILAGLILIALSVPRGRIQHSMGTWNRYVV